MIGIKNIKQGFTLLELLVVVLIIGILASIALPQYEKSVEKARLAEVLINVKAIEGSIDRYLLKNGFPNEQLCFDDFNDIELSGGEWVDSGGTCQSYEINKNLYHPSCYNNSCDILIQDKDNPYSSAMIDQTMTSEGKEKQCYTNNTDKGRFICKYLEPLGWEYIDDEW